MISETVRVTPAEIPNQVTTVPQTKPFERAMPRPWRVAIKIVPCGITLIVDLLETITIGRTAANESAYPHIDLSAYQALEMGVSRQHVALKLRENRVYIMDTDSANGVQVNAAPLTPGKLYPLRHGDRVKLGAMNIQFFFLMNPFEC